MNDDGWQPDPNSGRRTLQVDECRIPSEPHQATNGRRSGWGVDQGGCSYEPGTGRVYTSNGRWPANVCHDGSDEVLAAFAAFGKLTSNSTGCGATVAGIGYHGGAQGKPVGARPTDTGSAARFFYCAKAGKADRAGSKHPTIKPVALMRWLVRLVTPPGGVVLDPFAGSGTTGAAALAEGRDAILIEREPEYIADIRRRLAA
jgi:site-specific DNA-methyltransferase (adenine-specific)